VRSPFLARHEGLDGLDVVLTDVHLPGQSGIQLVEQCKPKRPHLQFLVITVFEDNAHLFNALCAGATGYLLKTATPAEIAQAIRDIHAGGSPMSLAIARMVVASVQQKQVNAALLNSLTKREHDLVQLLAEGYRYKEIADKLGLSIETVRTYIRAVYNKLQVHSRTEALNKLYER
jgi:DNA-binding NarL/FixJ family response regulator